MKKTFIICAVLLSLYTQGQSQSEQKRAKIKLLFSLMHSDSLIIKTFETISSSVVKQMSSALSDTAYTNAGINYSEKYAEIIQTSMETSKENALKLINEDMVDIYDKYFTTDDIDSFISFYQSTAGQKMVARIPDITKDITTVMATKYQPRLQESIMKEIRQMMSDVPKQ
jgi:hypothetical protein